MKNTSPPPEARRSASRCCGKKFFNTRGQICLDCLTILREISYVYTTVGLNEVYTQNKKTNISSRLSLQTYESNKVP